MPFLQDAPRPASHDDGRHEAFEMGTLVQVQQSKKFLYQREHFSETYSGAETDEVFSS